MSGEIEISPAPLLDKRRLPSAIVERHCRGDANDANKNAKKANERNRVYSSERSNATYKRSSTIYRPEIFEKPTKHESIKSLKFAVLRCLRRSMFQVEFAKRFSTTTKQKYQFVFLIVALKIKTPSRAHLFLRSSSSESSLLVMLATSISSSVALSFVHMTRKARYKRKRPSRIEINENPQMTPAMPPKYDKIVSI